MVKLQRLLGVAEDLHRLLQIFLMYRKGNILGIFPSDGLQNHVHIDVMLAQQFDIIRKNKK